jgi:hypothetical protein
LVETNLKDFTINWIVTGFLMFCLIAFATVFMYNNNPDGLGTDASTRLQTTYTNLNSQLISSSEDADTLLNITANTNPEVSTLGSRDVVATSYEAKGSATNYWETGKMLISWVFSGTVGKMIMSVFAGIIGFLSYFYISKHIRTGD